MRSEVACGRCSVPRRQLLQLVRRGRRRSSSTPPATRRTGRAAANEWRRKLRISAKYSSFAHAGQRPVVVDARDGLHAPAVAVAEAHAVDALGAADVGGAVAADRDGLVGGQAAGHARHPQHLAGIAQRAVDELVDLRRAPPGRPRTLGVHAGDELELRLAEIGGDVRVRERRAERRRVRRQRERAVGCTRRLSFSMPRRMPRSRSGDSVASRSFDRFNLQSPRTSLSRSCRVGALARCLQARAVVPRVWAAS